MERVKFALSAVVVAAAFCIMFPGFLTFAAGLGRMLTIIGLALFACLILAFATRYISLARKSGSQKESGASTISDSDNSMS